MTLADFTPEEQAVIDELRRRTIDDVTPMMLEDNYLFYRFAKARDYNLTEAESMLRRHLVWRKEFGLDTILTDYTPSEVLVKYVSTCLMCFDKTGCTVRYIDCGRLDCKGLWNCAKKQDCLKYFSYRIEQDFQELRKRNEKLQKQIFLPIFNFENLSYATATNMKTLQYCLYFLKGYVDNFPERLKCALVINAPFYFVWMFAVFKQVLPAAVLQKIRIYGADGWKEELLKFIDADVLPAFLGGNKTDPDGNPLCKTIVKHGEPIPKKYYMANEKKKLRVGCEKLTILPFSKEEISFEVKEENSNLQWEFEVKSRDIDFSLHFKGDNFEIVELIPKQRIDTNFETEKGLFKCEKTGTYTMLLDNTYSWIHSKEVYYKAAIRPPNDDKNEQWD
ncbi:retinal-binding protein-like isoform X2 [Argiope bruennichi]|nr:retinal-binding protein-like isoform X2 [Argiope bruennichi]